MADYDFLLDFFEQKNNQELIGMGERLIKIASNLGFEFAFGGSLLSWNNFYCQRPTALFHNEETPPLHM
jgi:hypothetical protein